MGRVACCRVVSCHLCVNWPLALTAVTFVLFTENGSQNSRSFYGAGGM